MRVIGYHNTTEENFKRIQREGLKAYRSYDNKIYFSNKELYIYGNICLKVDLTKLKLKIVDITKPDLIYSQRGKKYQKRNIVMTSNVDVGYSRVIDVFELIKGGI